MLALLASVLAPVASRAMALWGGAASPWDEICTAFGIKKGTPPAGTLDNGSPVAPSTPQAQSDCPLCLPSGNPAALPPTKPAGVPAAVERDSARFLFFFISAPPLRLVPEAARPRAPPQFA